MGHAFLENPLHEVPEVRQKELAEEGSDQKMPRRGAGLNDREGIMFRRKVVKEAK